MTSKLYNRHFSCNLGGVVVSDLRCKFSVTKDWKYNPNTLSLSIYNLSKVHRESITRARIPIIIEAGYVDNYSTIFTGTSRQIYSLKEGADWVTTVVGSDGALEYDTKTVQQTFAGRTRVKDVVLFLASKTGFKQGNVLQAAQNIPDNLVLNNGYVVKGSVAPQLRSVLKMAGLTYAVQNGALSIMNKGQVVGSSEGALLTPESGFLTASPPQMLANTSIVLFTKIRTLLLPDLTPGRRITVRAESLSGQFTIAKAVHTGDTHDNSWNTDLEMRKEAV